MRVPFLVLFVASVGRAQPPTRAYQQLAFLRRQNDVLVLTSTMFNAPLPGELDARLVVSHLTDTVVRTARTRWSPAGSWLLLTDTIQSVPSIIQVVVGAELRTANTVGAKTRVQVVPPPPLAGLMTPAVSQPIMIRAMPGPVSVSAPEPANALARMVPFESLGINGHTIYWETYGIDPTDSVDVTIWLERITPKSALRRLGTSLRIVRDINTPMVMSWSEPRAPTTAHVIGGPIPIIARTMVLRIPSRLPNGDYRLEISVKAVGKEIARNFRQLPVGPARGMPVQ